MKRENNIPVRPLRFLRWFCKEDNLEEVEGDLIEAYEIRRANKSVNRATRRLWWDVIKSSQ